MVLGNHEVLALIAYAEPVSLELLRAVVPYESLEALDAGGAIVHSLSGWRHYLRLARPVVDAPLSLCQLRLRRAFAQALLDTGLRRADDHFLLGRFQLDGFVKPDPETLGRAARYAVEQGDAGMARLLAEAAVKTGGGFPALLVRAEALAACGDAHGAELALDGLLPAVADDSELSQLTAVRARNLFHGLGRTAMARRLLRITAKTISQDQRARLEAVEREISLQCGQGLALRAEPAETARAALAQGKVRTAEGLFRHARQTCGARRATVLQCLGGLAEIAALTDRPADIDPLLESIPEYLIEECYVPAAELAPVWRLAARRDYAAARRAAIGAADAAAERDARSLMAQAWHLACRLGAGRQAAEPLASLAAENRLYATYSAHASALAERDLAALAGVAGTFAGMGLMLLAAEAASWAAAEHQRAGRFGTAAIVAHQAGRYLAECEGARSPGLRLAEVSRLPRLTVREQEVVDLALGGLSNADIASRLTLSVRTVETHLSRTYHKLGVAGRPGLTAALSPPS